VLYTWAGYQTEILADPDYSKIALFLNHLRRIICADGGEKSFTYLRCWLAKLFQIPDFVSKVAVALLSLDGAGKNTWFTDLICFLLGEYALPNVYNSEDVLGQFNSAIRGKKLVIMDESKDESQKAFDMPRFKGLTNGGALLINEKGIAQRECQNVINIMLTSNDRLPFQVSETDRRFFILDVSNEFAEPEYFDPERPAKVAARTAYFNALSDEVSQPEFYPTLFTWFMTMDLSGFDVFDVPQTHGKTRQTEAAKSAPECFIEAHAARLAQWAQVGDLHRVYTEFCKAACFTPVAVNRFYNELEPYGVEKK
jgi:hypothetical protein